MLSYGYENDMKQISESLPSGIQSFLMSATLSDEVESLKKTFCRNPAVLKLEEGNADAGDGKLHQFCVRFVCKLQNAGPQLIGV